MRLLALSATHACSVAGLAWAAWQLSLKAVLLHGGLHGPDATLYWTTGNAIRNGLTLYRDVFDPKPPGMFLLSAGSFSLFGDGRLGAWLAVLVLGLVPTVVVLMALPRLRGRDAATRWSVLLAAILVGLTLSYYNASIGGDWQTEFFGACTGLLYVAAIDADRRRSRMWTLVLACAAFAVTLLLKEPFLLSLLAAAVLLLRTGRDWLRLWMLPFLSACALYVVTLVALGALGSYFTIYLQGMLGGYIQRGGPIWARGLLAWERIWTNVLDFTGWFPLLVLVLVLFSLPRPTTRREGWLRIAASVAALGLLLLARSFSPVALPWAVPTLPALGMLGIGFVATLAVSSPQQIPVLLARLWRPLLAVYLAFTAIGLGADFHGQYFATAIPVYAAFFLCALPRLLPDPATDRSRFLGLGLAGLCGAVLLTATPFLRPGENLAGTIAAIRSEERRNRDAASALDRILDACSTDRYLFLEDRAYAPYARHSPLNFYLYTRIEHITRYHPIYLAESIRRFGKATIIVQSKPYAPIPRKGDAREALIGERVQAFVTERFTSTPWKCAAHLPSPTGYTVLFRTQRGDLLAPLAFDINGLR